MEKIKELIESVKRFFTSKIIWVQLLTIISLLFTQYGQYNLMNPSLAMFIAFVATMLLQKLASYNPIVKTGIAKDNTMFWVNMVGSILMITDYFLENQVFYAFGTNSSTVGIMVVTLNLVLRTYFTNQSTLNPKQ